MREHHKSKIYLTIFIVTALVLGWGVWTNYRPQVIYASCSDIADKTMSVYVRVSLEEDTSDQYDQVLHECLRDAGYQ